MRRGVKASLALAEKELKRESNERFFHSVILFISILSLLLGIIFVGSHFLKLTGYTSSVDSEAGDITSLDVHGTKPVYIWGGLYGLVLRVPGFTQQLSETLDAGEIERADIFFDCIALDAEGGPEFYAANFSTLSLLGATIRPGTAAMVDAFINCTGEVFCANNTFTENMTIYFGSQRISEIPSTRTYKNDGSVTQLFDIGVLNVTNRLVFVSHVNLSIQQGYNPEYLVNYQMLLPTPANSTQQFYFYADPNDECPSGGIGNSIISTVYGYVFDEDGVLQSNATIYLAGNSTTTNSSGFYNITAEVLPGIFNFIVQKSGYATHISNVTINSSTYIIQKNATLTELLTGTANNTITVQIHGTVTDTADSTLEGVGVYFGNANSTSSSSGFYNFSSLVTIGTQPIIGVLENYDVYYSILNVTSNTTDIEHNITLEPSNLNTYPTGPYTDDNTDSTEGDSFETIKEEAEDIGQDYWISAKEINKQVRENTFIDEDITIYNFRDSSIQVFFAVSPEIEDILSLNQNTLTISPDSFEAVTATISGTQPIGIYRGKITVSGDIEQEIPVKIEIVPRNFPIASLLMELSLFSDVVNLGDELRYRLNLENLLSEQSYQVTLKHLILNPTGTQIILERSETVELQNSLSLIESFGFPEEVEEGEYLLSVEARYLNLFSVVNSPFVIRRPLYLYSFFGIPLWIIFIIISFAGFIFLGGFMYAANQRKKKRYHLELHLDKLPKPGPRSIKLGRVAERNDLAYYNMDDLTTHAIVAGATGGGKSIAAQVFVEEMLLKGISVIVFDPTAQWSGMLRKCDDKKMLSFYPKFGLKDSDARAFPGSVRQIRNYKQSLNVTKYASPGQIQIFTMNKLTPSEIDIFVAGVISNIFKSDPKENPGLKTLLVFDEVHRLLPKFGGSGKGFLQIERACREFRKWGLGVMLVSQVLSDFVGEIKANINTEVQMRVAEENDLERIRERYGLDSLKALVRADVGTGMIQNAEYNKGLPYFVSLRPILHNTRRLSDEVLEKYNSYNDTIEELEFQIEQLEAEKVDTFDLKMELKLVKDKLMSGNFTVVDIYLEGLKPRMQKQWDSIGKSPKKRELALIDEEELESALTKAAKERNKWKEEHKEEEKKEEAKKVDISLKLVAPITFNNGAMISSLNELKDVLPTFDDAVFIEHVNDSKHEIADWIEKEIDTELGKKIKTIKDKNQIVKEVEEFIKKLKSPQKEEKKDEPK